MTEIIRQSAGAYRALESCLVWKIHTFGSEVEKVNLAMFSKYRTQELRGPPVASPGSLGLRELTLTTPLSALSSPGFFCTPLLHPGLCPSYHPSKTGQPQDLCIAAASAWTPVCQVSLGLTPYFPQAWLRHDLLRERSLCLPLKNGRWLPGLSLSTAATEN